MWETWVQSLSWEDPLEKGTATHSNILASIVHGVEKSWIRPSDFHFHCCLCQDYALWLKTQRRAKQTSTCPHGAGYLISLSPIFQICKMGSNPHPLGATWGFTEKMSMEAICKFERSQLKQMWNSTVILVCGLPCSSTPSDPALRLYSLPVCCRFSCVWIPVPSYSPCLPTSMPFFMLFPTLGIPFPFPSPVLIPTLPSKCSCRSLSWHSWSWRAACYIHRWPGLFLRNSESVDLGF